MDPRRRLLVEELRQRVDLISAQAEWDNETLLTEIGCQFQTEEELDAASIERLQRCATFLKVIAGVIGMLDVVYDKRAAIVTCSNLVRGTGRDPADLDAALDDEDSVPMFYFRLGEIDSAARALRLSLGLARASDRNDLGSPFAGMPSAHLSVPRARIHASGNGAEQLGSEVDAAIRSHVKTCDACRALVKSIVARDSPA
jgi:hypothetical protein